MERISIGGHTFYVNPEEVVIVSRSNAVRQLTKGGEVVQRFQVQDETITISGITADAGLTELQALQGAIEPEVHLSFSYPYKRMMRTVRVTSCTYTDSAVNRVNQFQYHIELMTEKPQAGAITAVSPNVQNSQPTGSTIEVIVNQDGEDIGSIVRRAVVAAGKALYTNGDYGSFTEKVILANPDVRNWHNLTLGQKIQVPTQ